PRVGWIGIQDGHETMAKLASSVDSELAKLGHPREKKEFRSHITIGRVKTHDRFNNFARGIEKIEAIDLGRQTVSSVAVMKSDLRPEGAVYTPLRVITLESPTV
ncbi:MAG: RNA 2',3'-cyclic phosphodiesterase, partial [Armatimonadetes bacterium]|nr:RNA 2',3'-cyclic phosphodiesterase [Armatimonadota bacterium]